MATQRQPGTESAGVVASDGDPVGTAAERGRNLDSEVERCERVIGRRGEAMLWRGSIVDRE